MVDKEDIVYYKLLPRNVNITAEVYCKQFPRLEGKDRENIVERKGFLQKSSTLQ